MREPSLSAVQERSSRREAALRCNYPQGDRPKNAQCGSAHAIDSPLVLALHTGSSIPAELRCVEYSLVPWTIVVWRLRAAADGTPYLLTILWSPAPACRALPIRRLRFSIWVREKFSHSPAISLPRWRTRQFGHLSGSGAHIAYGLACERNGRPQSWESRSWRRSH